MKFLYTVLLGLCVLQLVLTKPLNISSSSNSYTPAEKLAIYYDEEYDLMSQEICPKIKNITDEILKDEVVQKPNGSLMRNFKTALTEYQEYYPLFKRFGLNGRLVLEFADLMKSFYYPSSYKDDEDFIYIEQLLKKLGYNEIRDHNKYKFKKFLDEKFLNKYEEMQAGITNHTKIKERDEYILKWVEFLKECQEYECFLTDFSTYERKYGRFLSRIVGEMFHSMIKEVAKSLAAIPRFTEAVLKDVRLSQLPAPLRQQLIKNLQLITKLPDYFSDIKNIIFIHIFSYHILYEFDDYASILQEERQLIQKIFNDHNYDSLNFNNYKKEQANDDYITIYEKGVASLNAKELVQKKSLSEAVRRLENTSSPQEQAEAMKSLEKLVVEVLGGK